MKTFFTKSRNLLDHPSVEEVQLNIYSFPISILPVVGFSWQFVVFKRLTHDENIVSTSEWIRINFDWVEVGVRVGSLSLKNNILPFFIRKKMAFILNSGSLSTRIVKSKYFCMYS